MASRGVNKVILVGNLGQDPEVRYLPNNNAVANITVATSESWRDKQSGEQREKTEWHRVTLYGRLAEVAGEYLRKGSQVYIEGQLHTRKWQDQNGQDRYTTEVAVKGYSGVMQMLGQRNGAPAQGQGQPPPQGRPAQGQPPAQQNQPAAQQGQPHYPPAAAGYHTQGGYDEPPMDFDDDIPF